jgi:hypothetical protein
MDDELKKLLKNPALGIIERNAAERLKRAGFRLGADWGLPTPKEHPRDEDVSDQAAALAHD